MNATKLLLFATLFATEACPQSDAVPRIDIAHAPAPLFDDPVFHGATDPFVIWNAPKNLWVMYYTQRRASLPNPHGFDWVHGSAIGVATSRDGLDWKYLGTCQGDHDLSEPLKAQGLGPEPGVTWWAPGFIQEGRTLHMFVVLVDGVYSTWSGKRHVVHFTSEDGLTFKYLNTCQLSSERVIDPTVYKIKETYYMVYKDETDNSYTYRAESKDLIDWTNPQKVSPDGGEEAPFVFRWKNSYWMIVDNQGLKIYQSTDGVAGWVFNSRVLGVKSQGRRPKDSGRGYHPDIVVQTGADGMERCLLFYFTQQGNLSVIQLAELELGADGKVFCNRDQYGSGIPK